MQRFDGRAAWAALGQAEKDATGAIALELVAALVGLDRELAGQKDAMVETPLERALNAAGEQISRRLVTYGLGCLPQLGPDQPIHVPSLLGRVCRVCGCSEEDACAPERGGCHWIGEDLCSACDPATPLGPPKGAA